jgi:hypothetical protein
VSDQKLPVEKWKSEFDMMMDRTKWSGLALFVDKDGVYPTDIHAKGRPTSVSGIFDTVIDTSAAGDATGTAKSSGNDKETKSTSAFTPGSSGKSEDSKFGSSKPCVGLF